MSVEGLATQVGITAARLAAHEAGEHIKPEMLYIVARTLRVLIAEFFIVIKPQAEPREQPVDELADFPLLETERLLGVWRQLDEAAQRKALHIVRMVAGE